MFVGWFKIDGHSNPSPRKGFEQSKINLKKKQRLAESRKFNSCQFHLKRNKTQFILKIITAILLIALMIFGINFTLEDKNFSVVDKMEVVKKELTGNSEFVSREKINMRFANQEYKKGNYIESYNYYKEVYESGTSDKKVIKGLWKSSEKICETRNRYCEVSGDWERLYKQLK